ncbi:MAG: response regulator transcription factor [Gemmatimonadota bacterium]|nr:response regulator transcription factor [Gemmatimonadota bacterium]
MNETIEVLLADDHPVFRAGARLLLESEPDIRVVAEAATGMEAVDRALEARPDVVVLDAAMPRFGGIEASRRIASEASEIRILVLVMHAVEECQRTCLEAGAHGCLSKLKADRELIEAVRTVAGGAIYVPPYSVTITPSKNGSGNGRGHTAPNYPEVEEVPLSDREREVVILTAGGYSSREIGERLHISSKTVDTYRARSMEKLGFNHRWELVQYALRMGLLAEL